MWNLLMEMLTAVFFCFVFKSHIFLLIVHNSQAFSLCIKWIFLYILSPLRSLNQIFFSSTALFFIHLVLSVQSRNSMPVILFWPHFCLFACKQSEILSSAPRNRKSRVLIRYQRTEQMLSQFIINYFNILATYTLLFTNIKMDEQWII